MLARKQELNTQILQVADALLLAFSMLVAYAVRLHSNISIAVSKQVDPLPNYYWLVYRRDAFRPDSAGDAGFLSIAG